MVAKSALFQLAKALEGLPVLGCLQGSPAAKAGVRYGDILLAVNGRRTRSFDEYIAAKSLRDDGMHVLLFRSGSEQPIELEYEPNRVAGDPAAILAELIAMRALPADFPDVEPGQLPG
jgi:S1-C subfamily serine protease